MTKPTASSGDYCSFGRNPTPAYMVTHYRCDDYADGTVTDARTGEVVIDAPVGAARGFDTPRETGAVSV